MFSDVFRYIETDRHIEGHLSSFQCFYFCPLILNFSPAIFFILWDEIVLAVAIRYKTSIIQF